jgi:pimeloyl-ACP methyl ester carboxylesterase
MQNWLVHTPKIPDFKSPFSDLCPDLSRLNEWVISRESRFPNIRENCEAKIQWHSNQKQSDISIVFVHGFSASRTECDPFISHVAQTLRANVFYTRLRGHGRNAEAMREGSLPEWLDDTALAYAIGRRLGKRVILVGCSTGAALLTLLVALGSAKPDMLCLISPSFANANPASRLLEYRGRHLLLRMMMGKTRSWENSAPEISAIWTNTYPSTAILPYIDTMRLIRNTGLESIECPTLTFAAPKDKLVSYRATRRRLSEFSGPTRLHPLYTAEDPLQHNVVGSVLSPGTHEECTHVFGNFVKNNL